MKERVFSFLFIFFRGKQNDFFFLRIEIIFYIHHHGRTWLRIRCRTIRCTPSFSLSVTQTVEISVHSLSKLDLRGLFFFKFGWDVITYIKLYLILNCIFYDTSL